MAATATPHLALRPYVDTYVGYHDRMDPQSVHHGLPSPRLTVILAFDEPLDTGWVSTPERHERFWTLASGLHPEPALIRTHGHQHGIQLSLTPLGCRVLLGLPASAITTELVGHEDLPLGIPDDLHARLAAASDWSTRFRLLDRHLLALLARHSGDPRDAVPPEVRRAWALLARSRGRARIDDIATDLGWSRRRLLDAFRAEYGVSPKTAGRLWRFTEARRLIDGGLPLGEVAARAGFSDQQHLAREWRAMSARTPTEHRTSAYHLA